MKNFVKLTLFAFVMGNCATFYAASEKTAGGQKYGNISDAIFVHDTNAIKEFIKNGVDIRGGDFLVSAIKAIFSKKRPYGEYGSYSGFTYQEGSREVIQLLLQEGADPNAPEQGEHLKPLCAIYLEMNRIPNAAIGAEDKKTLMNNLFNIAQDLYRAGGRCDFESEGIYIDDLEQEILNVISQVEKQSVAEAA